MTPQHMNAISKRFTERASEIGHAAATDELDKASNGKIMPTCANGEDVFMKAYRKRHWRERIMARIRGFLGVPCKRPVTEYDVTLGEVERRFRGQRAMQNYLEEKKGRA